MDIKKHVPPFFHIPMPVDKDGNGPVKQQVAVKIFYEVWDQLFLTIASFEKEEDAKEFARLLNLQSH